MSDQVTNLATCPARKSACPGLPDGNCFSHVVGLHRLFSTDVGLNCEGMQAGLQDSLMCMSVVF